MQEFFNGVVRFDTEAEAALWQWGKAYEKMPDGSILVEGDILLTGRGLTILPDLRRVKVTGSFICDNNQLTSLEYAPKIVGGSFSCDDNQLTSLEHAPQSVGGGFSCHGNRLTSLEHAPQTVGGGFYCSRNQLTSLEHAPQHVGGSFACYGNQLTSLAGAPRTMSGTFACHNNRLISLEQTPAGFKHLKSDFGDFSSWDEVPQKWRSSPETRERELETIVHNATMIQAPMAIKSPLRFRPR